MDLVQSPITEEQEINTKKLKALSLALYNTFEKPIRKYLCYFFDKTEQEFFYEVTEANEGIVIPVTENYGFQLSVELVGPKFVAKVPQELLSQERYKEIMKYIECEFYNIFQSIVAKDVRESYTDLLSAKSMHLQIDTSTMSIVPTYVHPLKRTKYCYMDYKKMVENNMEQLQKQLLMASSSSNINSQKLNEKLTMFQNEHEQLIKNIESMNYDEEVADKDEKSVNEQYKQMKKLGLIFTRKVY